MKELQFQASIAPNEIVDCDKLQRFSRPGNLQSIQRIFRQALASDGVTL